MKSVEDVYRTVRGFFYSETPVPPGKQNLAGDIRKMDEMRSKIYVGGMIAGVLSLISGPPINKSTVLLGGAYTAYEAYKVVGNLQKIWLDNQKQIAASVSNEAFIAHFAENAPLAKRVLHWIMTYPGITEAIRNACRVPAPVEGEGH